MEADLLAQTISLVREEGFPILPPWAYTWLLILGGWKIVMMLSCVGILLIPIYQGKHSRGSHLWLIRRKYTSSNGNMPYLVPNKSLMIVLCEMLAAVMYLVLAALYYTCYRYPRYTPGISLVPAWCGLSLLPTYIGIWLSGWGWLYACHTSSTGSIEITNGFFKPSIFNFLSFSWPALVCISNLCITLLSAIKLGREYRLVVDFILISHTTSSDPSPHPDTQPSSIKILQTGASIWKGYLEVATISQCYAIFWIVVGAIMVAFYSSILFHVFRRISRILNICNSHESSTGIWVGDHEPDKTITALRKLRGELRVLALYIVSISLVCLGEVGVSSFQFFHSKHLNDSNWLGMASLLGMLPSTFISPILLLQCWRAFTERSAKQDPDYTNKSIHESPPSQLPIFHDQLLRWYEDPNHNETDFLHLDTFTGLVECPNDLPETSKLGSSLGSRDSTKGLRFEIIKSVEIRREVKLSITTHLPHQARKV